MSNSKIIYIQYSSLIGQLIRELNILNREQKMCYGLTLPQCYTLETLGQKNRQTMKELSQDMGVSLSTMTRVVDLLVRDDYIVRLENPTDRRQVQVELTPKGMEMYQNLKKCSQNYAAEILNRIPEHQRQNLMQLLEILIEAIKQVKQGCCLK